MNQDPDCLFCSIVAGASTTDLMAEADDVIAINDKFPRAPVHVLVMSREHIPSAHALTDDHSSLLDQVFRLGRQIAVETGIEGGYRIATNIGADGGQSIRHLHFHILGGTQLGPPDGLDS